MAAHARPWKMQLLHLLSSAPLLLSHSLLCAAASTLSSHPSFPPPTPAAAAAAAGGPPGMPAPAASQSLLPVVEGLLGPSGPAWFRRSRRAQWQASATTALLAAVLASVAAVAFLLLLCFSSIRGDAGRPPVRRLAGSRQDPFRRCEEGGSSSRDATADEEEEESNEEEGDGEGADGGRQVENHAEGGGEGASRSWDSQLSLASELWPRPGAQPEVPQGALRFIPVRRTYAVRGPAPYHLLHMGLQMSATALLAGLPALRLMLGLPTPGSNTTCANCSSASGGSPSPSWPSPPRPEVVISGLGAAVAFIWGLEAILYAVTGGAVRLTETLLAPVLRRRGPPRDSGMEPTFVFRYGLAFGCLGVSLLAGFFISGISMEERIILAVVGFVYLLTGLDQLILGLTNNSLAGQLSRTRFWRRRERAREVRNEIYNEAVLRHTMWTFSGWNSSSSAAARAPPPADAGPAAAAPAVAAPAVAAPAVAVAAAAAAAAAAAPAAAAARAAEPRERPAPQGAENGAAAAARKARGETGGSQPSSTSPPSPEGQPPVASDIEGAEGRSSEEQHDDLDGGPQEDETTDDEEDYETGSDDERQAAAPPSSSFASSASSASSSSSCCRTSGRRSGLSCVSWKNKLDAFLLDAKRFDELSAYLRAA
ncbi:hypothetical protein Efla_001568 [Eimeria flavescens]